MKKDHQEATRSNICGFIWAFLMYLFFIVVPGGGTLWNLQMFLQYIILEFTIFYHSPLSSLPFIPGIVSTSLIFPFTYMCTQYLYYIHLPTPFPYLLPPSHWYQPRDKTCSTPLFFDFLKILSVYHMCIHCVGYLSPTHFCFKAKPFPPSCSLIVLKRKHKR
jgi:hypothetical protein